MKKFKILIIDDQIDDRILLDEILVTNDYLVNNAANGAEALKHLEEELVDLIYIDVRISGMQTFMFVRSLKSNDKWKEIPVIFIGGKDDILIRKEIYDSGGDDFILKPIIRSDILTKTRVHLELKYSRQMAVNMNHMLEAKVMQRTIELEDSLKKLKQAHKELDVLEIAKSEFFNLISHEIRTPLNGILGSLALIHRLKLPDDVNRYFSLLDLSVKRLEDFSNTILEASILRIKGEKALMSNESDLILIIKDAIRQSSSKFAEKQVVVDFNNYSSVSVIKCDKKYILKCFKAVLDNAFKFSPIKGKLEIAIHNEPGENLKIVISDRGVGFSKISLENIYSAFANSNAHFDQNTGMGLHIAKLVIDAHSGHMKVRNGESVGAVVEIIIPVRY